MLAVLALLGYVYTVGSAVSDVQSRLDRNCRILAVIQANTRFIIIEHTTSQESSKAFQEIFQRALVDSCG